LGEDDDGDVVVVVVGGGFGGVFAGKSTAVAAGLLARGKGGAAVSLIEHVCVDLEEASRSRSDKRGGCARLDTLHARIRRQSGDESTFFGLAPKSR
jgi:hypothetical protein